MDERDLYVPDGAGDAEVHAQTRVPDDLEEFDPLASAHHHHDLAAVPEQKPVDFGFDDHATQQHVGSDEGQIQAKPKHEDAGHDDPKPKEPETPVDNANEEVFERRHHAPLTDQQDYNEIGKNFLSDKHQF
jgi:hypothetical protein